MRRGWVVVSSLVAFVAASCGGSTGGATPTPVTVGALGPIDAALLTQSQLRQVPTFSTAKVTPLLDLAPFDDADPRGPCGAKVARLALNDAAGVGITAETIGGSAQMVIRLPSGAAKRYLDARQANTTKGCAEFERAGAPGTKQRLLLVRIVRLHREFEQALAVVHALRVNNNVRAVTEIEVRYGDILSRTVIYTKDPIPDIAVRGIAAVMGQNLFVFDE